MSNKLNVIEYDCLFIDQNDSDNEKKNKFQ